MFLFFFYQTLNIQAHKVSIEIGEWARQSDSFTHWFIHSSTHPLNIATFRFVFVESESITLLLIIEVITPLFRDYKYTKHVFQRSSFRYLYVVNFETTTNLFYTLPGVFRIGYLIVYKMDTMQCMIWIQLISLFQHRHHHHQHRRQCRRRCRR